MTSPAQPAEPREPPPSSRGPDSVPGRKRATIYVGPADDPTDGPTSLSPLRGEMIVPSHASVDDLLAEIRKRPCARLEIEAQLATGGMGTIHVALDRALDRKVAVKTLHAHLRTSATSVRLFLREARLMGLLEHPNIVPVYDIGERDDGALYFTMKLLEGRTLAELCATQRAHDAVLLQLDVVAKVADALAFAHSRGVLHCDVKPANVMVGEFGQVHLMDWGIARLVEGAPTSDDDADDTGRHAAVIGTAAYMSPEQARGARATLDARADVFALGAVLYEVLTGRPPYRGVDRTDTLRLAEEGSYPPPTAFEGSFATPELEAVAMKAMAKDPSKRQASALELRDELLAASRRL